MAAQADPTKPLQPLDLIFSCNICHESIRDIPSPVQDAKELEGIRKPIAKLWMTECAHLICAKHLEGGAPPFHPAGQAPRAVCPVCVNRQNNRALKQMYTISGFAEGQYDSEIPHRFFQCPPVALDTKDDGMDALRFQFLGLVTYGIAIATKFRNLQKAHSHLKDQTDKLKLEKTEAETEIQTLTERITLAEEAERKYKAKEPEIRHYLEQFAQVKKELDRRNEELSSLGWVPPQTDYTFPPARLLEDDRSNNGHMATSHTGRSDHVNQANTRIVEDSIPSVASTTLRGDSSRAHIEDDRQRPESKRRKLDEYRYEPHNTQSPSKGPAVQKRPGIRLPLASSITRTIPSKSRHFQPPPMPYQGDNQQATLIHRHDGTGNRYRMVNTQHEDRGPWDRTGAVHNSATRSDDHPYMNGALSSVHSNFDPSAPFKPPKQQKRKIQPVDSIDDISRSDFIISEPLPTIVPPDQQYSTRGDIAYDSRSTLREPRESYGVYSETNQYSPARRSDIDYRQHQSFERLPAQSVLPRPYQSPYRGSKIRQDAFRTPYDRLPERPHTPSPQRVSVLQQSDGTSVISPFFRADQNHSSRRYAISSSMVSQTNQQEIPNFRMAPPRRPMQNSSQSRSQTMNGLSFVERPQIGRDYGYEVDAMYDNRQQDTMSRVSRDPNGLFVRPDLHQGPMSVVSSRGGTMHSYQHSGRPQPLPSRVPSLASSINIPRSRRGPTYDGALANIRGVKGGSASSRGLSTELFGSRPGIFSSSRRSIRR